MSSPYWRPSSIVCPYRVIALSRAAVTQSNLLYVGYGGRDGSGGRINLDIIHLREKISAVSPTARNCFARCAGEAALLRYY